MKKESKKGIALLAVLAVFGVWCGAASAEVAGVAWAGAVRTEEVRTDGVPAAMLQVAWGAAADAAAFAGNTSLMGHRGGSEALAWDTVRPETNISKLRIPKDRAADEGALVRSSSLIVFARMGATVTSMTAGTAGEGRRVVHTVQQVQVQRVFKGSLGTDRSFKLLTSGVEPLPDAGSPLNREYTGPLTDDEAYVLFLRAVTGHAGMFTLTGLWQGVYPVFGDKLIALEGTGFPSFDGLTLTEFGERIKRLER